MAALRNAIRNQASGLTIKRLSSTSVSAEASPVKLHAILTGPTGTHSIIGNHPHTCYYRYYKYLLCTLIHTLISYPDSYHFRGLLVHTDI